MVLQQSFLSLADNVALQAYDQHLNMILGDVEEVVTTVEIDDETYEEIVRVCFNLKFLVLHFLLCYYLLQKLYNQSRNTVFCIEEEFPLHDHISHCLKIQYDLFHMLMHPEKFVLSQLK